MTPQLKRVPMSNVDTAWLEMDSATNLMIINGVMLFDEKIDFEQFKAVLEERFVARYDRFRQRVVTGPNGGLVWETDPHFDIRSHARRLALPAPGDVATLQTTISAIISEPLDRRKPLWRFFLIENVNGGCAIFGRLHHCIADGVALIKVLLSMTADSAAGSLEVEPAASRPTRPPAGPLDPFLRFTRRAVKNTRALARAVMSETLQALENPAHALELAKSAGIISAASAAILTKLIILPPDRRSVFKGELGVIKRVVWSEPIDLGLVKQLGKATGATVNDVLVAAVAGALRRYMQATGDNLTHGDINAMVPVNLRPENSRVELGNQFALVYLALPVSLDDPMDRLAATKHHMDVLKNSPEPFLVYQILGIIGSLPLALAKVLTTWFSTKASVVLTNVPGPRQEIFFAGKPLKQIMFWVPQSGEVGLGISIISYNGLVTLGLMVDEKLVTNPQVIMHGFKEELELLATRVLPPEAAPATPAAGA